MSPVPAWRAHGLQQENQPLVCCVLLYCCGWMAQNLVMVWSIFIEAFDFTEDFSHALLDQFGPHLVEYRRSDRVGSAWTWRIRSVSTAPFASHAYSERDRAGHRSHWLIRSARGTSNVQEVGPGSP